MTKKPTTAAVTFGQIVQLQNQISDLEGELFWLQDKFLLEHGWVVAHVATIESSVRLYAKTVDKERLTVPLETAVDVQLRQNIRS